MSLDYNNIRGRLADIKAKSKLNNYEFCKIYSPDRCTASKATAENYMSAVFTGRNYPKDTSGPVYPELDYLQNLIDSGKFPGLTMNYLLYGDESPVAEKKVLDTNLHNWTLADFCEFILKLLQEYPYEIRPYISDSEKYEVEYDNGEKIEEVRYSAVLKFLEMDTLNDEGSDIGLGLNTFFDEYQKCQSISSSKARDVAIKELIDAIRTDDRFSKTLLDDCHCGGRFIEYGHFGPQVKSLNIE